MVFAAPVALVIGGFLNLVLGRWTPLAMCMYFIAPGIVSAIGLCGISRPEKRLSQRIEWPGRHVGPHFMVWLTLAAALALMLAVSNSLREDSEVVSGFSIAFAVTTPMLWVTRNAVLAPHLRRMYRRLGLRHNPWMPTFIGLAALLALAGLLISGSDPSKSLMPYFAYGSLACIAAAFVSLLFCLIAARRRISEILTFRATNGKSRPRHAR